MILKKKIIQIGAGHGIYIDKVFMKLLDLHIGDIIEIDTELMNTALIKIIRKKDESKNNRTNNKNGNSK